MVGVGAAAAELSVVVTADTHQAESTLGSFGKSLETGLGVGAGFALVQKGIDLVSGAFSSAGEAAVGFNSKLEQARIGFTSMLGSAEKADAFLQQLQDFAKTTPFEFPELVTASQRMLAFGFEAKDVQPLLTAVGSAAAAMGSGSSGVDQITKALGQMKAATVVQAGELNQLTEAGVPAFDILAKATGKTTGEVKKLVSEGKIASDVFINAFKEWAAANFGDMMEKQSHTFQGALSNIKDAATQATAGAFKPLFDLMTEGADTFAQFLQTGTFTAWADAVKAAVQVVADAIRTVIQVFQNDWSPDASINPLVNALGMVAIVVRDQVMPALQAFVGLIADHMEVVAGFGAAILALVGISATASAISAVAAAIAFLLSPIGLVAAAVGLLVAAWVGNWGGIQEKTQAVIDFIVPYIQQGLAAISAFWTEWGPTIVAAAQLTWDATLAIVTTAMGAIGAAVQTGRAIWDGLVSAWQTLASTAQTVWETVTTTITTTWETITTTVEGAIQGVSDLISSGWQAIVDFVTTTMQTILETVTAVWLQIPEDIRADLELLTNHYLAAGQAWIDWATTTTASLLTTFTTWIASVVAAITQWVADLTTQFTTASTNATTTVTTMTTTLLTLIQTWIQTTVAAIVQWAADFLAPITNLLGPVTAAVLAIGTAILTTIQQKVNETLEAVRTFGSSLVSALQGLVGSVSSAAASIGQAIIEGIRGAIQAGVSAIANAAANAVRRALEAAKEAAGIHSPSKVFADEVGKPIVEGIIGGVESMAPKLNGMIGGVVQPSSDVSSNPFDYDRLASLMGGHQIVVNGAGTEEVVDRLLGYLRRREVLGLRGGIA